MNRSHAVTLLTTVFALAVLGVAASTLHTARPVENRPSEFTPPSDTAPSDGGQARSGGRAFGDRPLPELNVNNGLDAHGVQSGRSLSRVAVGVLFLLFGALVLLYRLTGDDARAEATPGERSDVPENESPARSPPVELHDEPATNDVYRAWRDMRAFLDSHRGAHDTPAELARCAVSAGLPEAPVTELTALFCSVRYGGDAPTEGRERRARTALEDIRRSDRSTGADSSET